MVILTTSNVTEKIDLAFVDRADIKQYIGPPSEKGIYNIFVSCLEELMKVKYLIMRLTFCYYKRATKDKLVQIYHKHLTINTNL